MTHSHILPLLLTILLTAGCNNPKQQMTTERIVETLDTVSGISTLRELHIADSIVLHGTTYYYQYDFTACDSLRPVRNPQGDDYYDNQVTLLIRRNSHTILILAIHASILALSSLRPIWW